MKNHRLPLQGLERFPRQPAPRRNFAVPLLVAAGVIGVPVAIALFSRAGQDDAENTPVEASQAYPMNHYIPGAGYYHAPFHAWFPFPYNAHQAERGWFRGGTWRPTAQAGAAEREEQARSGGYGGRLADDRAAAMRTSRPNPEAVTRANAAAAAHRATNVKRGGFGSSARPGIT